MPAAYKKPQTNKVCTLCKTNKSVSEFYSHSQKPHLFHSRCKICSNKGSSERLRYKPRSSEQLRKDRLKYSYGLSWGEYQSMMAQQNGRCLICNCEFDTSEAHGRVGSNKPCVDHCHDSDKVRGILCGQCNRGLGFFRDNVEFLKKAASYLGEHQ